MDYLTARTQIVNHFGASFASQSTWHQGLKTYTFDVYTGRMNEVQKEDLMDLLNEADVNFVRMSGGRIAVMEPIKQPYRAGAWKYHPFNKDRDKPEYTSPSLVCFVGRGHHYNRVIVIGGIFQGTEKYATIDISWDPVVVGDWHQWCLDANIPSRTTFGWEFFTEFLVDVAQHPNWKADE